MSTAAVLEVAREVRRRGGRALLVGGCVRDELLGANPKDLDVEVFGLSPQELDDALSGAFQVDKVGASFGVLKATPRSGGETLDVALPRRETKLGSGHRAFAVEFDPSLPLADAAARRDFTINAIYKDPLTGEILDPWHGAEDLRGGVLRHVSSHFAEDPLRVLRGMQFVARFNLAAAPETLAVCRSMTPENLPPERLFEEWRKLLVKGRKISLGLAFLRETGWTRYYPELEALIGCEQAPEWHPEGDVWNHTLCCLDAFAAERDRRGESEDEALVVGLAVLCHDFGKPSCSRYDARVGRIRSLGHDEAGVAPTLSFLRRLTNEERILKEVPPLVRLHMRPYAMWKSRSGEAAVRRLAAEVGRIDRLIQVCLADDRGRPPFPPQPEALDWLAAEAERLAVKDAAPKPVLQGRDLVALGLKPGPAFGEILRRAYDVQLDGAGSFVASGFLFEYAYGIWRKEPFDPRRHYILWDWNGTLLDDTQAALDTLNIMLRKRGAKPIEMGFYRDNFAFPVRPFYERIGMVLENEDWDALAQEYHDIYHGREKRLNRNALAAVAEVAKAGVGQSIISALREDLLERDTRHFGIRSFMEYVAGVDNLDGDSKLLRARRLLDKLRREHPQIEEFVMIGDSIHDREVADALDVRCILCGEGSHAAWRLAKVAETVTNLMAAVGAAFRGDLRKSV